MDTTQRKTAALIRLKRWRFRLTEQQFRTLKGQILAGDFEGADKGLHNILIGKGARNESSPRQTIRPCHCQQ